MSISVTHYVQFYIILKRRKSLQKWKICWDNICESRKQLKSNRFLRNLKIRRKLTKELQTIELSKEKSFQKRIQEVEESAEK